MSGIKISVLAQGESLPMNLLLLADPSEDIVLSYIYKCHTFKAEQNGNTVGVLVLQQQGSSAEIMNLAIAEDQQGKGIGRILLKHAITLVKQQGLKQLIVCTGSSTLPALALYKHCGSKVESIDKGYFLRHYREPIFENGLPCTDQVKLRLEL